MFEVGEAGAALDDYRACTNDDLTVAYDQVVSLARVARAQALTILAVIDEREAWRADGAHDLASWVAMRESLANGPARSYAEVARALVGLPHIAALAQRGEISDDQLVPLARIASPETDEHWATLAPSMSAAELARAATSAERATNSTAKEAHRRRALRWWHEVGTDGNPVFLRIFGRLPLDAGEVVAKALGRIAEGAPPMPDGTYEPFDSRVADALTQLCSDSLAGEQDAGRTDRATVVIHLQADALRGDGDGYVQTEDGTPLAPEVARRLSCDARLQVVLDDPNGVPLGVGRTSRTPPPWLERLVDRRDGGSCRFPGCSRARGTQCHHIVHWGNFGPTDLDNLVTLCWGHHRLVHDHGWSIGGDPSVPGSLWVARPDGTKMTPVDTHLRDDIAESLFGQVPDRGG
ncbi:MAG: DUF222 domain-containing protein, partial [Acidimicrobiales bacterium]